MHFSLIQNSERFETWHSVLDVAGALQEKQSGLFLVQLLKNACDVHQPEGDVAGDVPHSLLGVDLERILAMDFSFSGVIRAKEEIRQACVR
jgi:hypothetical protein